MHRKLFVFAVVFFSFFVVFAAGNAWSQETVTSDQRGSFMHPDPEKLHKMLSDYMNEPEAYIDEGIKQMHLNASITAQPTSYTLMSFLPWNLSNMSSRNQGACGDCWVWAGTGLMEIAHTVHNGVKNRLSEQLFDSCYTDSYACSGGGVFEFASWYSAQGYAVPWSNLNAAFGDGNSSDPPSSVSCSSIVGSPHYPIKINSFQAQKIPTQNVGQDTAIANIKNILTQKKGVVFNFYLANGNDISDFRNFWFNQAESDLWTPDNYCGETWNSDKTIDGGTGGGHSILIVGYNDADPNTANQYWIVLNSWGTTTLRPHGIFHLPMYMNYDCEVIGLNAVDYNNDYSREFETADITFDAEYFARPDVNIFAVGITSTTASLSGEVNPNGGAGTAHFVYGETIAYGSSTPSQSLPAGWSWVNVKNTLSGLNVNTTYHAQLVATNKGGTTVGPDMTFKTAPPPTVTISAATSVTITSATLSGTVNPNGGGTTTYLFDYGTTTAYGNGTTLMSIGNGTSAVGVTAKLTGLTPNTTYHFRLGATNGAISYSPDMTFKTAPPPTLTISAATNVTATTATLSGTVNPNGVGVTDYLFDYGTTTAYGNGTTLQTMANGTSPVGVTANLTGLTPNTTYHFRLGATNGTLAYSPDKTFTTPAIYSMTGTVYWRPFGITKSVLPGATVSIAGQTATTDANGSFTITGIHKGTYTLTISAAGFNTYSNSAYSVTSNQTGLSFYLGKTILSAYSMSGTVYGLPVLHRVLPGATVSIAGQTATTDANGNFTITGILEGTYTLTISAAGYKTYSNSAYSITNNQTGLSFTLQNLI